MGLTSGFLSFWSPQSGGVIEDLESLKALGGSVHTKPHDGVLVVAEVLPAGVDPEVQPEDENESQQFLQVVLDFCPSLKILSLFL